MVINANGLDLFSQMIVNPEKEHENWLIRFVIWRARLSYKIIIQWSIWILYLHTRTENVMKRRKQRFFHCVSLFFQFNGLITGLLYILWNARATKSESYSTQNGSLCTVQQRLILFIIIKCTPELYRFFSTFCEERMANLDDRNYYFMSSVKFSQIQSNWSIETRKIVFNSIETVRHWNTKTK